MGGNLYILLVKRFGGEDDLRMRLPGWRRSSANVGNTQSLQPASVLPKVVSSFG
jgi:hypothetical protein